MRALEPRHAFPFAADVVLLEDALFWANEPVHNGERPVDALKLEWPDCPIRAYDIAPGFVIDGDDVVREAVRGPVDAVANPRGTRRRDSPLQPRRRGHA